MVNRENNDLLSHKINNEIKKTIFKLFILLNT